MNKLDQLNTVIKDNSRFYKINESDLIWIYDAHVHNVFSLSRNLYNALFVEKNQSLSDITEKLSIKENSYFLNIINNILQNETDNTNFSVEDDGCSVMINTSNRCNLNCSYCYRNKKDANINSIENIKKSIEWVMKEYKPKASKFDFTYSMSSESSIDIDILKQVLKEYENYEPQDFLENDLKQEEVQNFFKCLHRDFDNIKPDLFTEKSDENKSCLILILNKLIREKNLYEMLGMSIGMFQEDMRAEIQNRHNFSAWKANRVNRWILEVKYGEYIDFSKKAIPQYPSFSVFTNGTCATSDFIHLVKAAGINPLYISIDGPQKVHDFNRKFNSGKCSYGEVLKNIRVFQNEKISLCASAVLTSHYPKPLEIALHLQKLGFQKGTMTSVRPGTSVSFTLDNVDNLLAGYEELFLRFKDDALKNDFSLLDFLEDDYCVNPIKLLISRTKQVCRCNLDNQLVINAKGDVYNCLYFEASNMNKIGNINSQVKRIEGDKSVSSRNACNKCWARYLCGGTCFYASQVMMGNILEIEPVECKIRKHLARLSLEFVVFCRENNINL